MKKFIFYSSVSLWITRKWWHFIVFLFAPADVSDQSDPWASEKDQLCNPEDNRAHPAQSGRTQAADSEAPLLPLLQGEAALVSDHVGPAAMPAGLGFSDSIWKGEKKTNADALLVITVKTFPSCSKFTFFFSVCNPCAF